MAKSQKKIGKCERCGNTLIVDIDEDFYCNSWGCFSMYVLSVKGQRECFDIKGEENLVHGIYHKNKD